jgi:hypothetical protein
MSNPKEINGTIYYFSQSQASQPTTEVANNVLTLLSPIAEDSRQSSQQSVNSSEDQMSIAVEDQQQQGGRELEEDKAVQ